MDFLFHTVFLFIFEILFIRKMLLFLLYLPHNHCHCIIVIFCVFSNTNILRDWRDNVLALFFANPGSFPNTLNGWSPKLCQDCDKTVKPVSSLSRVRSKL